MNKLEKNTRISGTSSKETKTSRSLVIGIIIFVTLQTLRIITTLGELYFSFEPNKDNKALEDWSHFFASLYFKIEFYCTSVAQIDFLNLFS